MPPCRKSRRRQGWIQGPLDDFTSGAEGVGADAEDYSVAAADDPAGVGEDVRPTLEHEGDDP